MTPLTWLLSRLFPQRLPAHEETTKRLLALRLRYPTTRLLYRMLGRLGVRNGRRHTEK